MPLIIVLQLNVLSKNKVVDSYHEQRQKWPWLQCIKLFHTKKKFFAYPPKKGALTRIKKHSLEWK